VLFFGDMEALAEVAGFTSCLGAASALFTSIFGAGAADLLLAFVFFASTFGEAGFAGLFFSFGLVVAPAAAGLDDCFAFALGDDDLLAVSFVAGESFFGSVGEEEVALLAGLLLLIVDVVVGDDSLLTFIDPEAISSNFIVVSRTFPTSLGSFSVPLPLFTTS